MMRRLTALVCLTALLGGCAGASQVPTPRPPQRGDFRLTAPSAAASTPAATPTPTASPVQSPQGSPSPTASPTVTVAPTPTPSPTPTTAPTTVPVTPVPSTIPGPLPENEENPRPGPSPDPVIGCGISQEEISPLYGAFDRVVNSVGRPDQADYTGELVVLLQRFRADAGTCPGPERFESLSVLATGIDRAAATGEADLEAINQFRQIGNDWLDGMGLRPSLLS